MKKRVAAQTAWRWVVGALFLQSVQGREMHEQFKEVSNRIGVKNARQRVGGLGTLAYRQEDEPFFSEEEEADAGA